MAGLMVSSELHCCRTKSSTASWGECREDFDIQTFDLDTVAKPRWLRHFTSRRPTVMSSMLKDFVTSYKEQR